MAKITVTDNTERMITPDNEVKIERKTSHHTGHSLVWTMSFEDLVELQVGITNFMAGKRG